MECVAERCRSPCTTDSECNTHYVCYRGYCELGDRRLDGGIPDSDGGDPVGGDGGDPEGSDGGELEPAVCGNDAAELGEACDGIDLNGATSCADLSFGSGTLACLPTCVGYDLSACSGPGGSCNNGMAAGREQCDQTDLHGFDCTDLGYSSGTLACNTNCSFDVSGCAQ
jgi:hypothetical protein